MTSHKVPRGQSQQYKNPKHYVDQRLHVILRQRKKLKVTRNSESKKGVWGKQVYFAQGRVIRKKEKQMCRFLINDNSVYIIKCIRFTLPKRMS